MGLQEKLDTKKKEFESSAPEKALKIMHRATQDLRKFLCGPTRPTPSRPSRKRSANSGIDPLPLGRVWPDAA